MRHWPKHKGYSWETAPFLRILLPNVAGILLYSYAYPYPHKSSAGMLIAIMGLGATCFLFAALLHYRKNLKFSGRLSFFFLFQIMWLCLSWSAAYVSDITNNANWFGHFTNTDEACIVTISTTLQEKEKTYQTTIQVLGALNHHKYYPRSGFANLFIYKNAQPFQYAQGDTLLIPAKWTPIKNNLNPYAFNFVQLQSQKGLYYNCFLAPQKISLYHKLNVANISYAQNIHNFCLKQIAKYINDSQACALTQAMLLGDAQNLNHNITNAYAATGIVHIIAISGGNIGILFLAISFALSISRISNKPWLHYALAIFPVWCYVYIAGMGPSAVRASTMFTIAAIGFIINKKHNSLNQLIASACILLIAQPLWLFSLGFQLSFTAVLSLTLFYAPILNLYKSKYLLLNKFWNLLAASLAAQILVAPLVVYYFHLFPLLFLVANAAAFVFMGIVLIAAIVIIVCGSLPVLPNMAGTLCQFLIIHVNNLVFKIQHLNPQFLNKLILHNQSLIATYLIITGLAIYLIRQNKAGLQLALSAACLFLCISCYYEYLAAGQLKLVAFNAKSGSNLYFISSHHNTPINADSLYNNNSTLNSTEALCMWQAWQKQEYPKKNTYIFQGKKVLVLQAPFYANTTFHVNYLIINYNLQPTDLQRLYNCFSPQTIVLAYNGKPHTTQNCFEKAQQQHIPLYCVKYQGAFILSSN